MKRAIFAALLLIVPITALASVPVRAVVVMMKGSGHLTAKSLAASFDSRVTTDERDFRELRGIHGFAANLTDGDIAALKASGNVISIEPDYERHALTDTVTPGQQTIPYGVATVNAPQVWPVTRGKSLGNGPAIHVAIIDTGMDYNNPELSAAFRGGYNFIGRTGDPLDDVGHGSHVAGTIVAADDGAGVVGVASDVDVYSLKVLDACGSGRSSDLISAVDWIVQKKHEIGGNWIVNISLGAPTASDAEVTEFQAAADAGVLVFSASGNSFLGGEELSYPAGYPTVVSVGAVDPANKIAYFSQRGPDLKLVAPGTRVLSAFVAPAVSTEDGHKFTALRASYKDDNGSGLTYSACPPATVNITGTFVDCGLGTTTDFPPSVKGKIALVSRGAITFFEKAQNAAQAGAIGIIVYDNAPESPNNPFFPAFFTAAKSAESIPATAPFLGISQADGQALLAAPNGTVTMSSAFNQFTILDGTSMACPHAVGVAALVWAVSPSSTADNVATALEQTAQDLGDPGRDNTFGYGLVSAYHAAIRLNPAAFPVRARDVGRRGH